MTFDVITAASLYRRRVFYSNVNRLPSLTEPRLSQLAVVEWIQVAYKAFTARWHSSSTGTSIEPTPMWSGFAFHPPTPLQIHEGLRPLLPSSLRPAILVPNSSHLNSAHTAVVDSELASFHFSPSFCLFPFLSSGVTTGF